MTHKFKVGDRIQLEGVVKAVDADLSRVLVIFNGERAASSMHVLEMAHATRVEPVRPELKSGQVWEDACGDEVVLSTRGDGQGSGGDFPFYGSAKNGMRRDYRPDGTRFNEDDEGPSYLVKLIGDVAAHTEPCKGMNCGCTNGIDHSPECFAEHAAAIAGGKFVKVEPKAPPTLDTSKPIRLKIDHAPVEFLAVDNAGFIYVQEPSTKFVCKLHPECLKNIPEPKPTYEVTVGLVPFTCGPSIRTDFDDFVGVHSRASVTYTEGEGWSIEDIQP